MIDKNNKLIHSLEVWLFQSNILSDITSWNRYFEMIVSSITTGYFLIIIELSQK